MRGQVLGVDRRTGEGMVAGDDGRRYAFRPEDWAMHGEPAIGLHVDFEPHDRRALSVFPLPAPPSTPVVAAAPVPAKAPARTHRNRIVAALLAFFLGPLGVHRFYLGRNGSGLAMLIMSITIVGMVLTVPWALIDFVRYLLMDDDTFEARYAR